MGVGVGVLVIYSVGNSIMATCLYKYYQLELEVILAYGVELTTMATT